MKLRLAAVAAFEARRHAQGVLIAASNESGWLHAGLSQVEAALK